MKFPGLVRGSAETHIRIVLLAAVVAIGCFGSRCCAAPPAAAPKPPTVAVQGLVAGSVDLAAVIAFHPVMRNFDHRSGKFVSQVAVSGASTGIQAWKDTREEQRRIRAMEGAIEAQAQRVNDELMRIQGEMQEGKKVSRPEFEKLTRMNREYRELLAPLAERVLGGFPDNLLGELPRQNLERIMGEVFWAVQASAQARGAAVVLNTSTGDFKIDAVIPAESDAKDILERWNIRSLGDVEALVQASGSLRMPFEGERPARRPGLLCGGHFESVTDPDILKSLVAEFYDSRQSFSQPFRKMGATRHILSGAVNVTSIDLTSDAVSRLLDLYKSRPAEREAIMNLLRERLGN